MAPTADPTGRAFVVSELYYPEDVSTGHFLTGIAEAIAERLETHVLCAQPTYAARGTSAPRHETRNGVRIHRYASGWGDNRSLAGRLVNLLTISLALFVAGILSFRSGDTVVVVTNPPLLPYLTALACRLRGARLILLVHDVYPDVLVAAGTLGRGSFLVWALGRLSEWLYRRSDRVVVLGRDARVLIREKTRGVVEPIIIPNWGDTDTVLPSPRDRSSLLRELGLLDRFVIQYSGNIGRCHGVEVVADAASLLRSACPNAHLLVIGRGAREKWLRDRIRAAGLDNVTMLPYQPREALVDSLNACDLALISLAPGMLGVSVPSRLYNVMAAGKPLVVVADADSEIAMVVQEEGIGWVVPPGNATGLAQAVAEARQKPDLLAAMGQRARLAAERRYSRDRVRQLWRDLVAGAPAGKEKES